MVRIRRDVVIERMEGQELVAVSLTSAVVGEELSLELCSGSRCIELKVRVLDSRPVVIAGSLRHRLRLVVLTVAAPAGQSNCEPLADSPTTPEVA